MSDKTDKVNENTEQQDFSKTKENSEWNNRDGLLGLLMIAAIFGWDSSSNTTLKEMEQDKEISYLKGKLEVIEKLVTKG